MTYVVTINDKQYEVEVERGKAEILKTTVISPSKPVEAAPAAMPSQTATTTPQSVKGEPVKSPMPGTIIDVKVSVGSKVKSGDILFILEAMKMENEITASKDGTIVQIFAAKGASVATGDLLAAIE